VEARRVAVWLAGGRRRPFVSRHPGLKTSTGTIRLRPEDAAEIADHEFADLIRAALDTG
jgi:hypothetical protein